MKVKVGKFEIIETQTLLIPDGSDVWLEFKVLDWDVKLHILLEESQDSSDKVGYSFFGKEDHGVFILRNWDSEYGMTFGEAVPFGETQGRDAYLQAFGQKVGGVLKLELQVYLEIQE